MHRQDVEVARRASGAPSPEPGDDWRRKSDRHSWADMADSPRQPASVPGAIGHSFFQTLAISDLGHRQTLARGIYFLSPVAVACVALQGVGWRMVLEGDAIGFSFPFFRSFPRPLIGSKIWILFVQRFQNKLSGSKKNERFQKSANLDFCSMKPGT